MTDMNTNTVRKTTGTVPIPETVTHIKLDSTYRRELPKLPSGLLYLDLDPGFEVPIKKIPDKFPDTLLYLNIGSDSREIKSLPPNLIYLGLYSGNKLPQELPSTLTYLIFFHSGSLYNLPKKLPESLTHLRITVRDDDCDFNLIPHHVTHLILDFYTEHNQETKALDNLPQGLLKLTIEIGRAHV